MYRSHPVLPVAICARVGNGHYNTVLVPAPFTPGGDAWDLSYEDKYQGRSSSVSRLGLVACTSVPWPFTPGGEIGNMSKASSFATPGGGVPVPSTPVGGVWVL